jgi:hypothetical protein
MRVINVFEEVKLRKTVRVFCPARNKKVSRSKMFWQTINPYNRDAAGNPKTREAILIELRKEMSEWMPDCGCSGCKKLQAGAVGDTTLDNKQPDPT